MILTCPQCGSRYLLPANRLAPDGRKVKCTSCTEVWFQVPDPDELAEAVQPAKPQRKLPDDDFPEALKKAIGDSPMPAMEDDEATHRRNTRRMIGGYAAAAGVFALIFTILLMAQSTLVSAWPPSYGLYKALSVESELDLPGKGLVFDRLQAKFADAKAAESEHNEISLSGQLINLTSELKEIPAIRADLRDEAGAVLESHEIEMGKSALDPQEVLNFEITQSVVINDAYDLYLTFSLSPVEAVSAETIKTDAEAAESNPAHIADDPAPPSDGEEASESPAPASAHSH
jgi:predicted Zn finger-like uncharacterized protein